MSPTKARKHLLSPPSPRKVCRRVHRPVQLSKRLSPTFSQTPPSPSHRHRARHPPPPKKQKTAAEKRMEKRQQEVEEAAAYPTAPARAPHIEKTRVIRLHKDRRKGAGGDREAEKEEEVSVGGKRNRHQLTGPKKTQRGGSVLVRGLSSSRKRAWKRWTARSSTGPAKRE